MQAQTMIPTSPISSPLHCIGNAPNGRSQWKWNRTRVVFPTIQAMWATSICIETLTY